MIKALSFFIPVLMAGALCATGPTFAAGPDNPAVAALRTFSQDLWPRFRDTNQQYYTYVRAAADFRAYQTLCKRHELNIHLEPINQLAVQYLGEIITAHYEEPELAKLEGLSETEKSALIQDFANDVLAFEFGLTLSNFRDRIKATGLSDKQYCETKVREYQLSYIALLATANRQLDARAKP